MKIKFLFLLAILLSAAALNAQLIHEPNNEIYKDIDRWHVQGYIREFQPLVRPYPISLIEKILDEVIQNGDAAAQEKAALYQEKLAPGSRPVHLGVWANMEGKNKENGFIGAPFADGMFRITNFLSASFYIAQLFMTDAYGERFNVPGTYTPYADIIQDTANVGSVELRPVFTSLTAIGNSDVYLQAGLSRTSIGPFFDNGIVVGPQLPKAGHFSFVFYRPKWSFEMLFQTIAATDDFGLGKFPDKYSVIHYITFRPIENLELGFVQTMIWGGRFEPLYLVPFSFLYASQSLSGFDDNELMGLHMRWRPIDTFLVNSQIYVDDFSFNGIFTGESKLKLALEAGVSWAPKKSFLSKLDFDYTAVFPYCYTHWNTPDSNRYNNDWDGSAGGPNRDISSDARKPNYLNYTHLGRNIGPDLEPNSDRISVRTYWAPHPGVDVSFALYLIRHGNISDGLDGLDPDIHDGSIFDDGATDPWVPGQIGSKKNPHMNFLLLTQDTLDIRLGGGIGINWTIPIKIGVFQLSGEYGLEYGWNRGLEKGNNGLDQYWSIGGSWRW